MGVDMVSTRISRNSRTAENRIDNQLLERARMNELLNEQASVFTHK